MSKNVRTTKLFLYIILYISILTKVIGQVEELKITGHKPGDYITGVYRVVGVDTILEVLVKVNTQNRSDLDSLGLHIRTLLPSGRGTATISKSNINMAKNSPLVEYIVPSFPVELNLDESDNIVHGRDARNASGIEGENVIVGIIDTGIDLDHPDLLDELGNSRVFYLWDQTDPNGPSPSGFDYGREWTNEQIQQEINSGNCCTVEDLVGHGTLVSGIAAGNGQPAEIYVGMAPKAGLIIVKSALTVSSVIDGIEYIHEKSSIVSQNYVINLSLGTMAGPKDGSSCFEIDIYDLLDLDYGIGHAMIVSAGNKGFDPNNQDVLYNYDFYKVNKYHSRQSGNTETKVTVENASVNKTGDFFAIEIWYPSGENFHITLESPNNALIYYSNGELSPFHISDFSFGPGEAIGTLDPFICYVSQDGGVYIANEVYYSDYYPYRNDNVILVYVFDVNFDPLNQWVHMANGEWTLTMSLGSGDWDTYIYNYGKRYSDKYNLNNSDAIVFFDLSYFNNTRIVTEPGNAFGVITVGSMNSKREWIDINGNSQPYTNSLFDPNGYMIGQQSWFSSEGPTRDDRDKPDIYSPGAFISSSLSYYFRDNNQNYIEYYTVQDSSHYTMKGTSLSAPHVAGAAALLLEQNPFWTYQDVKDRLDSTANLSNGYELLDIYAALCEDNEEECDNSPHIPLDLDVTANENHSAVFAHKVDTSHKTLTLLAIVAAAVSCGFLIRRMI